ncbi:serine/arginine repetitive matrix protein 2-like [Penaeus chinensis]|uniref:serine/arginine repetitive matrix protein 2-like n=1 Tax=Penaeus chinensis TaxID=139456 RepID=UPI001FB67F44|nr:serine/arginine repetitive matrix protein 2-like [Penaeus chinensis]
MLRRCNSDDFGGRQWSSLAVLPSTMLPRAHYARRRSSSHTLQHPRRSASSSFSSSSSSSSSKSSTLKASSREVHMRALSELQSAASRLPHPGECPLSVPRRRRRKG